MSYVMGDEGDDSNYLFILSKEMERMEGGRVGFIPSISERKRKQPIGVVTLVTHDATPCRMEG
jgi:hypothetical protein